MLRPAQHHSQFQRLFYNVEQVTHAAFAFLSSQSKGAIEREIVSHSVTTCSWQSNEKRGKVRVEASLSRERKGPAVYLLPSPILQCNWLCSRIWRPDSNGFLFRDGCNLCTFPTSLGTLSPSCNCVPAKIVGVCITRIVYWPKDLMKSGS